MKVAISIFFASVDPVFRRTPILGYGPQALNLLASQLRARPHPPNVRRQTSMQSAAILAVKKDDSGVSCTWRGTTTLLWSETPRATSQASCGLSIISSVAAFQ